MLFIQKNPLKVRRNYSFLKMIHFSVIRKMKLFNHSLIPFYSLYPYHCTHPLSDKDHILTISGERKTDNENNEKKEKDKVETSNRNTNTNTNTNDNIDIDVDVDANGNKETNISENADMDSIKAKMENGVCIRSPYRYREGYDKEFKERIGKLYYIRIDGLTEQFSSTLFSRNASPLPNLPFENEKDFNLVEYYLHHFKYISKWTHENRHPNAITFITLSGPQLVGNTIHIPLKLLVRKTFENGQINHLIVLV
ncbi:hypothetical protein H8356DRAFT_1322239 [Neocallimastix lanati (nom. inval.)]|nr:hypothetical protein H8356DRAFT_1322239 [Neocallimastix sp. JGI-2020a]